MSVDLTVGRISRVELKNATEAAAHAGTRMLDGTAAGIARAKATAETIAGHNRALGQSLLVSPSGARDGYIQVGYWSGGRFVASEVDPKRVTAVRVSALRPSTRTFLHHVVDPSGSLSTRGGATAIGGGLGASSCPIPIAIPSCEITSATMCSLNVTFGPDTNDSAGWGLIGSSRPNANTLRDAINNCADHSTIDDVVTLNNGQVTSAAQALASKVGSSADRWSSSWGPEPARSSHSGLSASEYGRVLNGQIIVFDDPANCHGTKYNGSSLDVVGYMQVAIYDVDTTGAAGSRSVRWHSYCETSRGTGGGGYYGKTVYPTMTE